jgi:integrase
MPTENNKINFTKSTLNSLPSPTTGKRAYYYDSKIRGLGISITSTGHKSFLVYRKVNGKPERITLGRFPDLTIEQARYKAVEINETIAKGENPNDKRRANRAEITLGELFGEYLERYAKLHKKSWQADQDRFRVHMTSWSQRKLSTISKINLQKLHADTGHKSGKYEANRLIALLSVMFNKAIEFGLWDKPNPASSIKKFREQSRDRFLQSDELPRFFEALAQEPNEMMRDYFLLALLTGVRRSNLLAMKWEEINLERAEWRIPDTKNHTPQVITLVPEVIAILRRRKQNAAGIYVFPSNSTIGHLVEPKKAWQRILKNAGIADLRIHDLRRTLGSWQARTGASLTIIGKSLNHKSPQTTAIYARLDLDPVRASVEKATNAMLMAAGIKQPAMAED